MKLKQTAALLLACLLCLSLLAACGDPETPEEEIQNPVKRYAGMYFNDSVNMTIFAEGENGARISASMIDDTGSAFQWEMTGSFDEATMRIHYSDAVKKSVTFRSVDEIVVHEVLFENGKGYLQINDDQTVNWIDNRTLTWNDEQDPELALEPLHYVQVVESGSVSAD